MNEIHHGDKRTVQVNAVRASPQRCKIKFRIYYSCIVDQTF